MINEETQELNPNGRVELKNIIDVYQKKNEEENNTDLINDKDKDTKIKLDEKNNKDSEVRSQTTAEIEDLQTKNDVFLLTNKERKWDIRRFKIWKDYRVWLYMAVIVLIILFIIIVA